jgi:hypothetical protein
MVFRNHCLHLSGVPRVSLALLPGASCRCRQATERGRGSLSIRLLIACSLATLHLLLAIKRYHEFKASTYDFGEMIESLDPSDVKKVFYGTFTIQLKGLGLTVVSGLPLGARTCDSHHVDQMWHAPCLDFPIPMKVPTEVPNPWMR